MNVKQAIEESILHIDEVLVYAFLQKYFGFIGEDYEDTVNTLTELLVTVNDESIKYAFIDMVQSYENDTPLRVCDSCGKWMTEGYVVAGEEYACCDRCLDVLTQGDISEVMKYPNDGEE